ncbi:hypothetical protein CVT24_003758 [Panaeolus cyanescens]|uniref:Uncharacterized protein n=1 Tax=Panaeolus cyanescens TaxID=181874 RepID=A0A409YYB7_9AGAR|nr:hypothetical protein CVT24_003758 [Panaeolus cyanescens]
MGFNSVIFTFVPWESPPRSSQSIKVWLGYSRALLLSVLNAQILWTGLREEAITIALHLPDVSDMQSLNAIRQQILVFIYSRPINEGPIAVNQELEPLLISLSSSGCDNYMPYMDTILMPDGDCNFVCPGDSTELCGAGNRMVLYQNSAATPPSSSSCINWRGNWWNNILEAVPKTGGGSATRLYAIPTNPFTDPIYYTIISTCPAGCPYTDYYNFGLVDNVLNSYNSKPLVPNVGDSQSFIFQWPQTNPGYNGYCFKPNPNSPKGPFIGYPLLSASGNTDKWALCTNTTASNRLDIVYSPVANHAHYVKNNCVDVNIQVAPYA